MKKRNYVIVILVLFLIGSWVWFIYVNNKPKTSVDLVEYISINEDLSGLIATNASISEEDFHAYQDFFSGEGPNKVSQYSILEYNDNLLLIQTTPGLDNYQLYIQDMRIVELNEFQSILEK